jgi:hypothetical protein
MNERPILFSSPMVRALLDGSKTQTRRIMKPQPSLGQDFGGRVLCPYGQPGDRLWVREAFSGPRHQEHHPPRDWHSTDEIHYWADGCPSCNDWTKPRPGMFMPRWASRITLEITGVRVERLVDISEDDARAEGITDGGCLNCGESETNCGCLNPQPDARDSFIHLWESINGPGSWAANPWVWVVEFRRVG